MKGTVRPENETGGVFQSFEAVHQDRWGPFLSPKVSNFIRNKMPRNLKLVAKTTPLCPAPPRPLGRDGMGLWRRVHADYQIEDVGGLEMLAQACAAVDRAEGCRQMVDQHGPIVKTRSGIVREHPALRAELSARAFVVRTLARLGLDVEPVRPIGRPPGGKDGY